MPVFSFVDPNVIILIVFSFRNELMIQNKNRTRSFVCVFFAHQPPRAIELLHYRVYPFQWIFYTLYMHLRGYSHSVIVNRPAIFFIKC